jgi:hypothetical protein
MQELGVPTVIMPKAPITPRRRQSASGSELRLQGWIVLLEVCHSSQQLWGRRQPHLVPPALGQLQIQQREGCDATQCRNASTVEMVPAAHTLPTGSAELSVADAGWQGWKWPHMLQAMLQGGRRVPAQVYRLVGTFLICSIPITITHRIGICTGSTAVAVSRQLCSYHVLCPPTPSPTCDC